MHRSLGEIFEQDKEDFLWSSVLGDSDSLGNPVDPFLDFLECWRKCKTPYGSGPVETALAAARANPRPCGFFGDQFKGVNWEKFRRFLEFCEVLQGTQGDSPILLPHDKIAQAFPTSTTQAKRWVDTGKRLGFLEQLSEGYRGHAAEFRFRMPEN